MCVIPSLDTTLPVPGCAQCHTVHAAPASSVDRTHLDSFFYSPACYKVCCHISVSTLGHSTSIVMLRVPVKTRIPSLKNVNLGTRLGKYQAYMGLHYFNWESSWRGLNEVLLTPLPSEIDNSKRETLPLKVILNFSTNLVFIVLGTSFTAVMCKIDDLYCSFQNWQLWPPLPPSPSMCQQSSFIFTKR